MRCSAHQDDHGGDEGMTPDRLRECLDILGMGLN
jgi:hypothetical protein